jgi:hypothetical protein
MALTVQQAEQVLRDRGCIVNIGQIDATLKRRLDKAVREGRLAKWRATWTAPLGGFGIGPLKTVYGLPELNPHASVQS